MSTRYRFPVIGNCAIYFATNVKVARAALEMVDQFGTEYELCSIVPESTDLKFFGDVPLYRGLIRGPVCVTLYCDDNTTPTLMFREVNLPEYPSKVQVVINGTPQLLVYQHGAAELM